MNRGVQTALYLGAFVLALAVRLMRLGALPLSDSEAQWALQALSLAQGSRPAIGSQAAYVLPTALLFFLYGGGTNFLARLIPALTGSMLVFLPYLFRERLQPRSGLILALWLALEPGLVAVSRQAGSPVLALTFLLLAWGLWEEGHRSAAGVFAGLALLGGPSLWLGLLALGLTRLALRGVARATWAAPAPRPARPAWRPLLEAGLVTLVLGGTLFLAVPSGLSAPFSALAEHLAGWSRPSGVSWKVMLLALATYQPLTLLLAGVAIGRGWAERNPVGMGLSAWAGLTLLLMLLYPAHRVWDLAWTLIPLTVLAAQELARSLDGYAEERREALGLAGLIFLLVVFIWLNFLGWLQTPASLPQAGLRVWLLAGSFFLLVVSVLLVAAGWSLRLAQRGALWGLVAALGLFSLRATIGAAGLRPEGSAEMWDAGPSLPQADLILASVEQISDWSNGTARSQPVVLVGLEAPSLQWLLRERPLESVPALPPFPSWPILITPAQEGADLSATYRGQGLVWRQVPLWEQASFADWARWLALRQMPSSAETVLLWVRQDLFLDSR